MIFILNRAGNVIDTLSNDISIERENIYFEDLLTENLSTFSEVLTFSAIVDENVSKNLIVGNYIIYKKNNINKALQIIETTEEKTDCLVKQVYCETIGMELINSMYTKNTLNNVNVKMFLENILQNTSWSVGYVDTRVNKVISLDMQDKEVYSVLQENIHLFDCEIDFRVEIKRNKIVGKYIDVYYRRGSLNLKRLELGRDIEGIVRKIDISNFATKLIGENKNGMTFKDIEAENKPLGQDFVINEEAYQYFNNNGHHITRKFVFDTQDARELLLQTQKELERVSKPNITYEVNMSAFDASIYELGDEVTITDYSFTPPLMVSSRIVELQTSSCDVTLNKAVLSNFVEIKSYVQKIGNSDIVDNAISTDKIQGEAITGNLIKADTIEAGHIKADTIETKHLQADSVTADKIEANSIKTEHLQADSISADKIQAGVITADHILSGTITANEIAAGTITAGSGIIADGAIGNAQISSIDAAKIEAGTIDTSKVTVAGQNSNLKISGNRLQVFEGIDSKQYERVSLGDVNGDGTVYGFRVRGADGQTVLIDENGVKSEGITDGSINNDKIAGDAAIDGSKLNINSVINSINKDGTEVIQGTKINVDGTNLETKLSTITLKQDEDGERISQAYSKIEANEKKINLKVDNQTYQTDKNNMTTTLNKNTSEISLLKDKIALKVEQTDITNAINNIQVGGRNLIKNSLSIQLSGTDTSTNTTHQVIDSNNGHYKIIINNNNRWNRYQWLNNNIDRSFTSNLGEKYTISMDVKVNKLPSNDLRFSFNVRGNGLSPFGVHNNIVNQISKQNIWIRVYSTVILPTDNADRTSVLALLSSDTGGQQGLEVEYKNLKLEKGSKGTDWSLAPEDINKQIETVDEKTTTIDTKVSNITTDLNNITSRVSDAETTMTTIEKTTERKLINNFSNSNTLDLWSAPGTTLNYSSIVGYYMDCLSNNQNHMIQSEYFEIDSSKSYKISLMQQFAPNSGTATFYFGIYAYDKDKNNIGVYVDKATSLQTNPYFMARRTPANDYGNWRTWSGYIYSHDTIIQDYTPKGNVTSCMKFSPKTKYLKIRFLHYRNGSYGDSGQGNMYFAQPAIYEIDNQIVNTEQRLKTAEQKITKNAIISTVESATNENGEVIFAKKSEITQLDKSWTAKFNDGYDQGIVTMNKNGIIVSNSTADTSTVMSADGFQILDSNDNPIFYAESGEVWVKGTMTSTDKFNFRYWDAASGKYLQGAFLTSGQGSIGPAFELVTNEGYFKLGSYGIIECKHLLMNCDELDFSGCTTIKGITATFG